MRDNVHDAYAFQGKRITDRASIPPARRFVWRRSWTTIANAVEEFWVGDELGINGHAAKKPASQNEHVVAGHDGIRTWLEMSIEDGAMLFSSEGTSDFSISFALIS